MGLLLYCQRRPFGGYYRIPEIVVCKEDSQPAFAILPGETLLPISDKLAIEFLKGHEQICPFTNAWPLASIFGSDGYSIAEAFYDPSVTVEQCGVCGFSRIGRSDKSTKETYSETNGEIRHPQRTYTAYNLDRAIVSNLSRIAWDMEGGKLDVAWPDNNHDDVLFIKGIHLRCNQTLKAAREKYSHAHLRSYAPHWIYLSAPVNLNYL